MKRLWVAFIVLAALGSIYPFNFQATGLDAETLGQFLQSCCKMPSRGDILGNVILFVPIGFFGMLAASSRESQRRRVLYVCLVAFGVAFALQVLQIYLPSRDENLQDVVWNMLGTVSGAALAHLVRLVSPRFGPHGTHASLVPITLIAVWLIYRLLPLVPSLDFQLIKDSLKPVFHLQWTPVSIVYDLTAWLVVAYLLRRVVGDSRLTAYLGALVAVVFSLEVLIVDNSIDLANVIGATLALLLSPGISSLGRWHERMLVLLISFTFLLAGLTPFILLNESIPFEWLPFRGFLGGSMYINTQSAAEKIFLYGSLVYIMWRTGIGRIAGLSLCVALVTTVEFAQTRFLGHTPEISDPLLVGFAAIAMLLLEMQDRNSASRVSSTPLSSASRLKTSASEHVVPRRLDAQWVRVSVRIRENQLGFLTELSEEMRCSISRVIRKIIADFLAGLDDSKDAGQSPQMPGPSSYRQDAAEEVWSKHTVNLRKGQLQFLDELAQEMGGSVSSVVARIIARFIEDLETE